MGGGSRGRVELSNVLFEHARLCIAEQGARQARGRQRRLALRGVEGGGVAPDVLAEIVLSLETDNEVAEYCTEFLGKSAATSSFVAEVCARRQTACGSAR